MLLLPGVKLVVSQPLPKEAEPSRPPTGSRRPALRVLPGGLPRSRRAVAASEPRLAVAPPPAAASARLEEVPIYLRPIPSWVPRLW